MEEKNFIDKYEIIFTFNFNKALLTGEQKCIILNLSKRMR